MTTAFETHQETIAKQPRLQEIVIGLHGGPLYDLSRLRGMDRNNFKIAMELLSSYHQNGENDEFFFKMGSALKHAIYLDKQNTPKN